DAVPGAVPGVRCEREGVPRHTRFVRAAGPVEWMPANGTDPTDPVIGAVEPIFAQDDQSAQLTLSGWVVDPAAVASGIEGLDVLVGRDPTRATRVAAQVGLQSRDAADPIGDDTAPTRS